MLKLFGALLIIFSCSAFAVQYVIRRQDGLKAVRELRALVSELARAISFRLEPLPDLIRRLAAEDNPPAAGFIRRLEIGIGDGEHRPLGDIWDEALAAFSDETHLPEQAKQLMRSLGARLGQMDFETETARLSEADDQLKALLSELEADSGKTEKTVKSLGVLLGILIVIIFI
ncbi:MAG: stage III sporulation protein AB [Clostridia bacterium]